MNLKKEAVNLVTEHNYSIKEAAERLDINSRNFYNWINSTKTKNKLIINKKVK